MQSLAARLISRSTPTPLFLSTTSLPDAVSCVGWDGRPLRRGEAAQQGMAENEEISVEEDNQRYYEKRKPSMLSEVEFADTRKPISRATDRVGGEDEAEGLMVRETVDEALRRGEELWWEAKVRGDPESPQAKALARMLAGGGYKGMEFE